MKYDVIKVSELAKAIGEERSKAIEITSEGDKVTEISLFGGALVVAFADYYGLRLKVPHVAKLVKRIRVTGMLQGQRFEGLYESDFNAQLALEALDDGAVKAACEVPDPSEAV